MKQKLIWLDEALDFAAIETIKRRYGSESDSAAIRLALRVLAESERLIIELPPRPKHARRGTKNTKQ